MTGVQTCALPIYLNIDMLGGTTFFVGTLARIPVLRDEAFGIPEIEQCVDLLVPPEYHIASDAAVPSVRTTLRDELFPPPVDDTVPPFAGADVNFCRIDEHRDFPWSGTVTVRNGGSVGVPVREIGLQCVGQHDGVAAEGIDVVHREVVIEREAGVFPTVGGEHILERHAVA